MVPRRVLWPFLVMLARYTTTTSSSRNIGEYEHHQRQQHVRVMTRNLYLGADVAAAFELGGQPTYEAFLDAVAATFAVANGSDFELRMDAVAAEIQERTPWLVGLQELTTWTVDHQIVVADFGELLLDKLAERGLRYEIVTRKSGFDFAVPALPGGVHVGVRDEDAILARSDLMDQQIMSLSNARSGNFATSLPLPIPERDPQPLFRQWNSVDINVGGFEFRFVNTHLEYTIDLIRIPQVLELIYSPESPLNTELPVILVGDLNAVVTASTNDESRRKMLLDSLISGIGSDLFLAPEETIINVNEVQPQEAAEIDPEVGQPLSILLEGTEATTLIAGGKDAADLLLANGFVDAWLVAGNDDETTGLSCCHDALLADPDGFIDFGRYDYVLLRGNGLHVADMEMFEAVLDPAPNERPLWPSDHLGFFATIALGSSDGGGEE